MTKGKKERPKNETARDISEEEYFKIKSASLREVGTLKKIKNELRYYKKHLGNAFKSYNLKEHIFLSLCFFAYAAAFFFTARAVFFAIPNDASWKGAVLFLVLVAFVVGGILIDNLWQVVVVKKVKKDPNARQTKGIVVVSSMKSQHVLGRSGHSQNVFSTTYRVVVKIDGLRSVTYTKNRYYEKGEEIVVFVNTKRPGHCYIPCL